MIQSRNGIFCLNASQHQSVIYVNMVGARCESYDSRLVAELYAGSDTPGIFRINGQSTVVDNLYNYWVHTMFGDSSTVDGHVVAQVVASSLPTHIDYTMHDVASLFKKFVGGLPGGLLGSTSLFQAFRSIVAAEGGRPDTTMKARLVALALRCIDSRWRMSIICATIGLIAHIGGKTAKAIKSGTASPQAMSNAALSVIFGPLLLRDMIDDIEPVNSDTRLLVPGSPKKPYSENDPRKATLEASMARLNTANWVLEKLLSFWPEVVIQLSEMGKHGPFNSEPNMKKIIESIDPEDLGMNLIAVSDFEKSAELISCRDDEAVAKAFKFQDRASRNTRGSASDLRQTFSSTSTSLSRPELSHSPRKRQNNYGRSGSRVLTGAMDRSQDHGGQVQDRPDEEYYWDEQYDDDDTYTMAYDGEAMGPATASSVYSDELEYPVTRNAFMDVSFTDNTDSKVVIVLHISISRLPAI